MSIDSPHALRVEVARLQRELNAAQAAVVREKVRADAANSKLAATDVERLQALSALAAANARADAAEARIVEVEELCANSEVARMVKLNAETTESLAAARRECEGLRKALTALLHEVEESGNGDARDFGWGHALKLTRAALAGPAPAPGEET